MGSCFSVEGGKGSKGGEGGERNDSTETSQVVPVDAVEPATAASGAAQVLLASPSAPVSEVAIPEVMGGTAHAGLISNQQVPENHVHFKMMTYEDLHKAAEGFRNDLFLGKGGFGSVYKGFLESSTIQNVAIKVLDLQGEQGDREFLSEIMILGKLSHPNLVKLVGFCADRGQRLLVYEYMPLGSLFNLIHDLPPGEQPLDWSTRLEILLGTAKGLQHLHDDANPPVINRDVKSDNILLGEGYHPKLSDFGLAKLGPTGDHTHVSTRVMGTDGYCAPEYFRTGKLTVRSDIYSFGVVMLEVLTGRKAKDESVPAHEQYLAVRAFSVRNSKSKACKMADPALQGQYHKTSFFRTLVVAVMCVSETPNDRPSIADVVEALTHIIEGNKKWLARQQA